MINYPARSWSAIDRDVMSRDLTGRDHVSSGGAAWDQARWGAGAPKPARIRPMIALRRLIGSVLERLAGRAEPVDISPAAGRRQELTDPPVDHPTGSELDRLGERQAVVEERPSVSA